MLGLTQQQIDELCYWAELADREVRSDLVGGFIKDENDYTSNFTGALRRNVNSYSRCGLRATSYLLPAQQERSLGCDATIIIAANGYTKVAYFEAKWPRFSSPGYRWDYPQTASGLSHFSDQLDRQAKSFPQFAIFEMFYCEFPYTKQPKNFPNYGSACTWHDEAYRFKNNRTNPDAVWVQSELSTMLNNGCRDIATTMRAICECKVGEPIHIGDPLATAREFSMSGEVLVLNFRGDVTET